MDNEILELDITNTEDILREKAITRAHKIFNRIGFFAWGLATLGTLLSLASVFFFFVIAGGEVSEELSIWLVLAFFGGLAVAVVGGWMLRQRKVLRAQADNLEFISSKITGLGVGALFIGILMLPIFAVAPVWGFVALVVVVLLAYDLFSFSFNVWNLKRHQSSRKDIVREKNFTDYVRRALFPKVKQDKLWHRVITVGGWILVVFSWGILLPFYFSIIQRIIYFVAYGKDESKWLDEDSSDA